MSLFAPQPQPQPTAAGSVVKCDRCGVALRFSGARPNPRAQPIRHAKRPKGVCATCALRIWFEGDGAIIAEIVTRDLGGDPGRAFRLPHVQAQVKRMMEVGKSDASVEEIDFEKLILEWDLPIPGAPGGKRR